MVNNPDIVNNINPLGTHTSGIPFSSTAVGGKRRRKMRKTRTKKMRIRRTRTRRTRTRKIKLSKSKKYKKRRQHGGLNPTYQSYSANFDSGKNGIFANGPSVGTIIKKYD